MLPPLPLVRHDVDLARCERMPRSLLGRARTGIAWEKLLHGTGVRVLRWLQARLVTRGCRTLPTDESDTDRQRAREGAATRTNCAGWATVQTREDREIVASRSSMPGARACELRVRGVCTQFADTEER